MRARGPLNVQVSHSQQGAGLIISLQPAITVSVFVLVSVRISIHPALISQLREILSLVGSLLPSGLMCAWECKAIICLALGLC